MRQEDQEHACQQEQGRDERALVEQIIEQTLHSRFEGWQNEPPISVKSADDLSPWELLNWRSAQGPSHAEQSDRLAPPKGKFSQPADSSHAKAFGQIMPGAALSSPWIPFAGAEKQEFPPMELRQFTPFSFQEPFDKVQSVTTHPLSSSGQGFSQRRKEPLSSSRVAENEHLSYHDVAQSKSKGGTMVDLSEYKDLTKPPVAAGGSQTATLSKNEYATETEYPTMSSSSASLKSPQAFAYPTEATEGGDLEIYSEYSGNVRTLVQLVNDLPEGVTKQTGAQIIRLTMEAMGISMETVLSDAQAVQSELLDAVRTNIKKIEEYKTVIRKLESEIRYHQGKANELSEIIDLFILSNTSPNMPNIDRPDINGY